MAVLRHIAIFTRDIDKLAAFYCRWFACKAGPLYENKARGFKSRFLDFGSGFALELMRDEKIETDTVRTDGKPGYAHMALGLGSRKAVDDMTQAMKDEGITVLSGPRVTGDGYYESLVLDPDGNRIELTV